MPNVIIIGKGPAGISAALYTTRAGIDTVIIGKDLGALEKTDEIENYFGFSQPISGRDLINNGIEGARRLGAKIISDEVLGLSYFDKFIVTTNHEALQLLPISNSVTLLTNGKQPRIIIPDEIKVNTNVIDSLEGDNVLNRVIFKDGNSLSVSGLFVAVGVAGSTALAKKLGAATENNKILVDENMATNIPGLFAAGDCTGGLFQISKAVYEGAKAGMEVVKYLRNQNIS